METPEIIGLIKEIEDANTGATSSYHVLDSYYVSKSAQYAQGTFATYVSDKTYKAGKQPIGRALTVQVNQLPPTGQDLEQWLYQLASTPAEEGAPNPSELAGATPVTA